MTRFFLIFACLLSSIATTSIWADDSFERTTVFRAGDNGYHTYRIPSILRAKDGTLLAFAEARKNSGNDSGEINIVVKRSRDNGKTFGPQEVVWADEANTCGNPCAVMDESSGTLWLLATHNLGSDHEKQIIAGTSRGKRTVWILHSEDHGKSWSKAREITPSVSKPDWAWYATGPGIGIQLQHGPHSGRLVIPCDHILGGSGPNAGNSHVIYSDDHGANWKLGGEPADETFNESQIVELPDGKLMLNMRIHAGGPQRVTAKARGVAISEDGGEHFGADHLDQTLVDPRCQGSILRFTWPENGKSCIVFSNVPSATERRSLAIRLSFDEGTTWPASRKLTDDPAAYSCLVKLAENRLGVLFETGLKTSYERIDFARCKLSWLTNR